MNDVNNSDDDSSIDELPGVDFNSVQSVNRSLPNGEGIGEGINDDNNFAETLGNYRKSAESNRAAVPNVGDKYRITKKIGQGGMGEVYLGEQFDPKRLVALKVVKAGKESKETVARFEAERQSLAKMSHPNIATVYDAGFTDSGEPFFVMEYVEGTPLGAFCDRNKLTVEERLDLFINICDGVAHAHQKGIIHRDLKPGNILVENSDGNNNPKIIDFGLAKKTDQSKISDKTINTEIGQIVGTVNYLSPEQAGLNPNDIDTRSDLYTLGVILYELLVGTTPVDKESVRSTPILETLQSIRTNEPKSLASKLRAENGNLKQVCLNRQTSEGRLKNLLKGDLDSIVMKSLSIDRDRRYQTASEFADDIKRFRQCEPVLARPTSQFYRIKKLVMRNQMVTATIAVSIVGLVAALCVSIWFGIWANNEAIAAKRARDESDESRGRMKTALAESEDSRQRMLNILNDFRNYFFDELSAIESTQTDDLAKRVLTEYRYWIKERKDKRVLTDHVDVIFRLAELRLTVGAMGECRVLLDEAQSLIENNDIIDDPDLDVEKLRLEFWNLLVEIKTSKEKPVNLEGLLLRVSELAKNLSINEISENHLITTCEILEKIGWQLYELYSKKACAVAQLTEEMATKGRSRFSENLDFVFHEAFAINRKALYIYKGTATDEERAKYAIKVGELYDKSIALIQYLILNNHRPATVGQKLIGFHSNKGMYLLNGYRKGIVSQEDVLENYQKPISMYRDLLKKRPTDFALRNTFGVILLNQADSLQVFGKLKEDEKVRLEAVKHLKFATEKLSHDSPAGYRLDLVQVRLITNQLFQGKVESAANVAIELYERNPNFELGDHIAHLSWYALVHKYGDQSDAEKERLLERINDRMRRLLKTQFQLYRQDQKDLMVKHELFEPFRNLPEFKAFWDSQQK